MRALVALLLASASAAADELPVPRFASAVVVPPRLPGPRPVLVVLHGMGDSASAICPAFDALVEGRSWILCPRGVAIPGAPDEWTFPIDNSAVAAEVRAALAALERAHPDRVRPRPALLAGFSLGAMFAAAIAVVDPTTFPRALIVDTHHVWTQAQRAHFVAGGGRGALFACSRTYVGDCRRRCRGETCIELPDREHGYDDVLFARLRASFERLVADDARWSR